MKAAAISAVRLQPRIAVVLALASIIVAHCAECAHAAFGILPGSVHVEAVNRDGSADLQAGSHPYALTVGLKFNRDANGNAEGSVRDVVVDLPPGFAGNPIALPRCPREDLAGVVASCPGETQVGSFKVVSRNPYGEVGVAANGAVYNIVPRAGVAATLGFSAAGFNALQDVSVVKRNGVEQVEVRQNNIPLHFIVELSVTVWGVPQDLGHDPERICQVPHGKGQIEGCPSTTPPRPFLTLPATCGEAPAMALRVDSVEQPDTVFSESVSLTDPNGVAAGLSGCDALDFAPKLTVQAETSAAASPTGLHTDVHLPQRESISGLGEAPIRNLQVRLPTGLTVNPASAGGLESCSTTQIELESSTAPHCPRASQIGTVSVDTPVLDHPLAGQVYLAAQGANPFNSLVAIYVVVNDPATGIVVKLAGHVEPDPVTGQVTATFSDLPQVPFEDVKVDFFGGQRAALMTGETCSTTTTHATFTAWSFTEGQPPLEQDSPFQISSGAGGAPCAYSPLELPNQPTFEAGTVAPNAGTFSPFMLRLARGDSGQRFGRLSVTLPPGLIGKLAGVARCTDTEIGAAQAPGRTGAEENAAPSCPSASRVGTAITGLGAGATPFSVSAPAYLSGPYEGAPLSLTVIVPAIAGPFDLGVVVVRSALFIDPATAQVTARTDALPTIIDGFQTDVRSVAVSLDRPGFALNPTSCDVMAVTGQETSTAGQAAALSERFQVGGCATLPFKPSFAASTNGTTSKLAGASLRVKVSQRPGEANIHKVTLQLPGALPARLTTLQKACLAAQFDENPAGCPAASNIGSAKAVTPLLNVPFTGPAYLVSHGSAKFPDVVFVLQAEGIVIDVVAQTDIKNGITYSRLETVPDAPVSSFEAVFPQGPHSVLSAFGNLCSKLLSLNVSAVGQNGVGSKQSDHIRVNGCPRPAVHVRASHPRAGGVTLILSVSEPGTITASGPAFRQVRKPVTAGTTAIHLSYSSRGKRAYRKGQRARLTLRMTSVNGGSRRGSSTLKL